MPGGTPSLSSAVATPAYKFLATALPSYDSTVLILLKFSYSLKFYQPRSLHGPSGTGALH